MASEILIRCLAVASGGAVGSLARYGLSLWGATFETRIPWGTLAANAIGCLVMGFAMYWVVVRDSMPDNLRLFLAVGLLGSLTTFSTFSYEALDLYRHEHHGQAVLYVCGSVILALALALTGWWAAGVLVGKG